MGNPIINMMNRDKILQRDKEEVKEVRRKLMAGGMTSRNALKHIKKNITKAVKEKIK